MHYKVISLVGLLGLGVNAGVPGKRQLPTYGDADYDPYDTATPQPYSTTSTHEVSYAPHPSSSSPAFTYVPPYPSSASIPSNATATSPAVTYTVTETKTKTLPADTVTKYTTIDKTLTATVTSLFTKYKNDTKTISESKVTATTITSTVISTPSGTTITETVTGSCSTRAPSNSTWTKPSSSPARYNTSTKAEPYPTYVSPSATSYSSATLPQYNMSSPIPYLPTPYKPSSIPPYPSETAEPEYTSATPVAYPTSSSEQYDPTPEPVYTSTTPAAYSSTSSSQPAQYYPPPKQTSTVLAKYPSYSAAPNSTSPVEYPSVSPSATAEQTHPAASESIPPVEYPSVSPSATVEPTYPAASESSSPVEYPTASPSATVEPAYPVAPEYSGTTTTSSATAVYPPSASQSCPMELKPDTYESPYMVVPIDSEHPNTTYGSSYNVTVSPTVGSIFNFAIPQAAEGKTCTLSFAFPSLDQLEGSSFTTSGMGNVDFFALEGPASDATSYGSAPTYSSLLQCLPIYPGKAYQISSGPCAAGQTVSYEMKAKDSYKLEYMQDASPCPIGLYITYE